MARFCPALLCAWCYCIWRENRYRCLGCWMEEKQVCMRPPSILLFQRGVMMQPLQLLHICITGPNIKTQIFSPSPCMKSWAWLSNRMLKIKQTKQKTQWFIPQCPKLWVALQWWFQTSPGLEVWNVPLQNKTWEPHFVVGLKALAPWQEYHTQ